jgi:hypothetical protein
MKYRVWSPAFARTWVNRPLVALSMGFGAGYQLGMSYAHVSHTESQYEILILKPRGWQARGEDELQSSGSRQHAGWVAETSSQEKVLGRRQS